MEFVEHIITLGKYVRNNKTRMHKTKKIFTSEKFMSIKRHKNQFGFS